MKQLSLLLALMFILLCAPQAHASQTPTSIYTVEEFLSMEEGGNYILMEDLDLAGYEWPCPDFSGQFAGNGHAILNLYLTHSTRDGSVC